MFSAAEFVFLVSLIFLAASIAAQLISATDCPNLFHGMKVQSDFLCITVIKRARSSQHEFTALVMRACAGCRRVVIATPYRLRVAIATPRIENQTIPTATMARSATYPASTIYDVDCRSIRVDADNVSRPASEPSAFLNERVSLFGH